jgi:hypothetical protein
VRQHLDQDEPAARARLRPWCTAGVRRRFGTDHRLPLRRADRPLGLLVGDQHLDGDAGFPSGPPAHTWSLNFVFEPTSGTILVRDEIPTTLWAYEVDTNTWTEIDQSGDVPQGFDLEARHDCCSYLTYDTAVDRLVFTVINRNETWTFDLQTGAWTRRDALPIPVPGSMFESGGESAFDRAAGRTVVFGLGVLGLYDAATDTWEQVHLAGQPDIFATLVYDSLNRRVVLLQWNVSTVAIAMGGDLWAVDLQDRSWIPLLSSGTG